MDEETPPVGLSEDEAFEPPSWVMPVLAISALALMAMVVLQVILGIALVTGDAVTVEAWDFWGDPGTLGALLLASALLMAVGSGLLVRRRDDSLALLLLGMMVLEGTMLWGLVRFEGAGGPTTILVLMFVPMLAMFGLQSKGVRQWYFQASGTGE